MTDQLEPSADQQQPPQLPTVFDPSVTHFYRHEWVDGSFLDEQDLLIAPLPDEVAVRYLGGIRIDVPFKEGRATGEVLTPNAEDCALNVFAEICRTAGLADGEVDTLHASFPREQVVPVVNSTVMNVAASRPLFKRNDPNAPKEGETLIVLRCWYGQHKDAEGRLFDHFVETKFFFRNPKAAEYRAWDAANDKHTFEKDNRGNVTVKHSQVDTNKASQLIRGSRVKQMEPLFLRAENYAGEVPFYHLYYAASELLKEDPAMGKLSAQRKR
jgi:hypothetical protein